MNAPQRYVILTLPVLLLFIYLRIYVIMFLYLVNLNKYIKSYIFIFFNVYEPMLVQWICTIEYFGLLSVAFATFLPQLTFKQDAY